VVLHDLIRCFHVLAAGECLGRLNCFFCLLKACGHLAKGKQLYEPASGATKENQELESLTENLKIFAKSIKNEPAEISQTSHLHFSLSGQSVLNNLRQQCVEVSDELL
jgi:hypothetical protein